MKIYDEITMILDDNGEWKVISEDSFDHNGDIMLMKDSPWRPSTGEYGWFGAAASSKAGQRNRGLAPDDADTDLMQEAENKLNTLQIEYDRLTGGESIFDVLKRAESEDATLTASEGLEEIAARDSAGGFSGGGGTGPRNVMLKKLRNTVKKLSAERDEEETAAKNRIRGNMQEILLSVKGALKDAGNEYDLESQDEWTVGGVPGYTEGGFEYGDDDV